MIISRAARDALRSIFSSVRVLSKGSMIRVQIIGRASSTLPFRSCCPVCMWQSASPGMTSLPLPEMCSFADSSRSLSFASRTD